ncbi:MAG: tRNA (adenosine(37)-N6)-threonylcarbamoyltransferase complex dimerization subunit type 1 TsaB [Clostridiales bacterium]|nr:tRNA (adenosine(37)-N6)-threonylcarbamoyltransferase complex dimerization subunit type 1 TsaB [Clostridiales bacterium]
MIVLAIDTTALTASAALTEDGRLLGLITINAGLTHSETILPAVEQLLNFTRKKISDLGLIAVTVGPGSFTGVRIGVATVKGLAFERDIPCAPVSTLEALARNLNGFEAHRDSIIVPVMDARRSQLYNAIFRGRQRLTEDRLISADELKTELGTYDAEEILLVGDGCEVARRTIYLPALHEVPEYARWQNAASVAECGLELYNAGGAVSAAELLPLYLRMSQAERERAESRNT